MALVGISWWGVVTVTWWGVGYCLYIVRVVTLVTVTAKHPIYHRGGRISTTPVSLHFLIIVTIIIVKTIKISMIKIIIIELICIFLQKICQCLTPCKTRMYGDMRALNI